MKRDRRRAPASIGTPPTPPPTPDLPEWLQEVRLTVENKTPLMQVLALVQTQADREFGRAPLG